jgi:hypothetical protein
MGRSNKLRPAPFKHCPLAIHDHFLTSVTGKRTSVRRESIKTYVKLKAQTSDVHGLSPSVSCIDKTESRSQGSVL